MDGAFVVGDIDVTNATLSDFEKDETGCHCYRAKVTPTGTSGQTVKVTLSIAANVVYDRSGNANFALEQDIWATVP